jgi:hypothetical protein
LQVTCSGNLQVDADKKKVFQKIAEFGTRLTEPPPQRSAGGAEGVAKWRRFWEKDP